MTVKRRIERGLELGIGQNRAGLLVGFSWGQADAHRLLVSRIGLVDTSLTFTAEANQG